MVARQSVAAGDTVAVEEPFAAVLYPDKVTVDIDHF